MYVTIPTEIIIIILSGNYRALVFPFIVLLHLVIVFVYPQAPVQIQGKRVG